MQIIFSQQFTKTKKISMSMFKMTFCLIFLLNVIVVVGVCENTKEHSKKYRHNLCCSTHCSSVF